ncbi:fimbrial protein [Serratia fonticola]
MNKRILGLVVAASVLACATATAAPVANLKINGDIKPPTCTVNGGEQADLIYNLGAVSPSLIPQSTGYNSLPKVYNKLTVDCDAPTYLTFKSTDNYQNAFIEAPGMLGSYKSIIFNLVDANSPDKTVGGISYSWENVTADGKNAYLSRANDGLIDNNSFASSTQMIKGATVGWTSVQQKYVSPDELQLVSAKNFTAQFFNPVNSYSGWGLTYLLSKDELIKQGVDISEGVDYTGNVILTFNFGV